jgi:hypothetical protein
MANNSILGILSASSLEHQLLEICKASQTVIQNQFEKNSSLHSVSNGFCEKKIFLQAMGCSFESDENCKLNTYIGTAKLFHYLHFSYSLLQSNYNWLKCPM